MFLNRSHKIAYGLYNLGWSIALPWLGLNQRLAEGYRQRRLRDRLPEAVDLWIQAASVGESFLALEVINTLHITAPLRILLTSNTRQGIEILEQGLKTPTTASRGIHATVRYFPFDKPTIMEKAVGCLRPKLMVLLEAEIWPGLLRALKLSGCRSMIINGRLTDRSLKRYLIWPKIWRRLAPDKILAISAQDADRFGKLFGDHRVEVMPNIKFDRIAPPDGDADAAKPIGALLSGGAPFLVLASIRRQEEPPVGKILAAIQHAKPETVIGLFPRHLHRLKHWQQILNKMGLRWSLRSSTDDQIPGGRIILWDTFGELGHAYKFANSVFVGGSLAPLGGQNFLEALVSGVIPVIGPSWENFAWVGQEIIAAGLLKVADDWEEAAALLLKDVDRSPPREEVIHKALHYVKTRQGGTRQACRQISAWLQRMPNESGNNFDLENRRRGVVRRLLLK